MHTPLISVILPVYNGSRFLKQTIDSILSQTYTNLEVIIVDDASTDDSRSIIDAYDDSRIHRVYLTQNLNVCNSSNTAFAQASGEYMALIGHDDMWQPEKLEKQLAYMEEHPECGACFTRCTVLDEQNRVIDFKLFDEIENDNRFRLIEFLFYNHNHLCAPSALIRSSTLHTLGYYDYSLLYLQDYELWLRILTKQDLYILEERLTDYRIISDTGSNLSVIDETGKPRMHHETIYSQEKLLFGMDDTSFINTFQKHFLFPDASGEVLLTCEKILLLKELANPYYIWHLMQIINKPEYRTALEITYHITLQDFYKINADPVFCEPTVTELLSFYTEQIASYETITAKQQAVLEKQSAVIERLQGN